MPIIWIEGMPCSGKSSIAIRLTKMFLDFGIEAKVLDGDEVRHKYGRHDFSRDGRVNHIRKVLKDAMELSEIGHVVICSFITPYEEMRDDFRGIENFLEVYLKCSKDECRGRDVKGMWKRADNGEIENFTGVDDIFEEPQNANVVVNTEENGIQESAQIILEAFADMVRER